jgi:hypothetical protein
MRHVFLAALFVFMAGPIAPALAQDSRPSPQAQAGPTPTRIEVDTASNVIRFFVGGREQAVLDAGGLHVNGNVDYSGTITDGNRYSQPSGGQGAE